MGGEPGGIVFQPPSGLGGLPGPQGVGDLPPRPGSGGPTVPGGTPGPQGGDLPPLPGAGVPGFPGPMTGTSASAEPGRTRWEYEFAAKPRSLQEFRSLLRRFGEQGWEFAGVESFEEPRPAPMGPGGAGSIPGGMTSTMVVFKRPVRGAITTSGPSSPRYGSGGMSTAPGPVGTDPSSSRTPGMSVPGGSGFGPGPGMFDPSMPQGGRGPEAGGFKVIALKTPLHWIWRPR